METSTLHFGSDALIWIGIGILGYFLNRLISSNDKQHKATTAALEKIAGRIKSDEEILGLVNGKYISRRENELMLKESDRAHANIAENLASTNKEVTTLREHWHGAITGLLTKISTQMERR